jgi:hypothetical protein
MIVSIFPNPTRRRSHIAPAGRGRLDVAPSSYNLLQDFSGPRTWLLASEAAQAGNSPNRRNRDPHTSPTPPLPSSSTISRWPRRFICSQQATAKFVEEVLQRLHDSAPSAPRNPQLSSAQPCAYRQARLQSSLISPESRAGELGVDLVAPSWPSRIVDLSIWR